jgi:hypothetical protein
MGVPEHGANATTSGADVVQNTLACNGRRFKHHELCSKRECMYLGDKWANHWFNHYGNYEPVTCFCKIINFAIFKDTVSSPANLSNSYFVLVL